MTWALVTTSYVTKLAKTCLTVLKSWVTRMWKEAPGGNSPVPYSASCRPGILQHPSEVDRMYIAVSFLHIQIQVSSIWKVACALGKGYENWNLCIWYKGFMTISVCTGAFSFQIYPFPLIDIMNLNYYLHMWIWTTICTCESMNYKKVQW